MLIKYQHIEIVISELPLWIIMSQQFLKIGQHGIARPDLRVGRRKKLAPVGPGLKRRQLLFDQG